MVFTAPFTAVPGEIITAAGWNTSARDNINHIWGVIGGNPGTSGLVPHSIGASASTWGKVTDDLLNDQKISQAPIVSTNANSIVASGLYILNAGAAANMPFDGYWYLIDERYTTGYHWQIAGIITDNNHLWVRTIVAGTPSAWARIWTSVSDGATSGLDADTVRTLLVGNASGNIPYNNGTLNTNLNAQFLNGIASSSFLQALTFLYTSVSGSLPMTTSYSAMGSVTVTVAGTYAFFASGNMYLDPADANVYFKLDHGGVTFGQLTNAGHLESGTRPFGIVGRVVIGSVPVTVSVGGAKGGGAGGTVMEQVALLGVKLT